MRTRLLTMTLGLLWAAGAAAASSSDEARAWVKRMNTALINSSYYGELTHRWSGGAETLRLVHTMRDGKMVERVTNPSTGYEFVRDDKSFIQYLAARPGSKPGAKRIVLVQTRNRSYGYIAALNGLNEKNEQVEKYYSISKGGTQTLLGWPKPTQLISVEPKDELRFGYRLWLDPESALPVKTQLISKSGEVIDEIAFINLRLVKSIPDEMLKRPNPDDFHWKKMDELDSTPVKRAFVPHAKLLPDGYYELPVTAQLGEGKTEGPKTRFIMSDGISWVSVVVTVARDSAIAEGFGVPNFASTTYVARRDGHYISVMGEVPPAVAKSIAGAFRPEP